MIERDPVSGNEVPLGGKPEEVRDNIDAKLSDGEYVLPADVVRYFGVQHIERMVQKAKEGMMEMASNGRINGEDPRQKAVPPGGPNGGPPSGDPSVRKFAGGGYNSEYQFAPQASMPGDPPIAMDGYSAAEELRRRQEAPVQMADGGYAQAEKDILGGNLSSVTSNLLNPSSRLSFGGPGYGGSNIGRFDMGGSSGVTTETYINSAGERMSIMFVNGVPMSDIPDGFFPDNEDTRRMFAEQNTRGEDVADPSQQWDEDGRDSRESNNWRDEKTIAPEDNYFGMSGEQLMDVGEAPKGTAMKGLAGMGIAGAAVGAINAMKQGEYLADIRARATAARELGHTEAAKALDEMAANFAEEVPQAVKWAEKLGGVTGEGILKTHADAFQTYTEQQVVENTWLGQNGTTGTTGATGGGSGGNSGDASGGQGPATDGNGTPVSPRGPLSFGSIPSNTNRMGPVTPSERLSFGNLPPADGTNSMFSPATRRSIENGEARFSFGDLPDYTRQTDLPLGRPVNDTSQSSLRTIGNGFELDMGITVTDNNTGQSITVPRSSGGGGGLSFTGGPTSSSSEEDGRDNNASNGRPTPSPGARGVGSETAYSQRNERNIPNDAGRTSGAQMTNPGGFDEEEGNWASGPFNRGGLVSRPNMQRKSYRKIRTVQK